MHPQARIVAFMAHRGYAQREEALTRIDASSLLATRAADEGEGTAPVVAPHGGMLWRWAVAALVAIGVGAAALLVRL
jgi:hypothetical protein